MRAGRIIGCGAVWDQRPFKTNCDSWIQPRDFAGSPVAEFWRQFFGFVTVAVRRLDIGARISFAAGDCMG